VAVVDERLAEVEESALDVAEVDVEDLLAEPEVADHLEDLPAGVVQHLGDRALAEVQAVVGARVDVDEALQALDAPENRVDSPVTPVVRHAGVVRVAGQAHLALFRHRYYPVEEVRDPLPVGVRRYRSRLREWRLLARLLVLERAVAGAAAPGGGLGPHDAQDT